jgi:hypothetical protein
MIVWFLLDGYWPIQQPPVLRDQFSTVPHPTSGSKWNYAGPISFKPPYAHHLVILATTTREFNDQANNLSLPGPFVDKRRET